MRALLLHLLVAVAVVIEFMPSPRPSPVAASTLPAPAVSHAIPAAPHAPPPPAVVGPVALADTGILPEPRYGYLNTARLTVRERPSADSPVAARIVASELAEYAYVSILATEGVFLNVSYEPMEGQTGQRFEGWVKWGEIVPAATALLVDARTGETRAVLPLAEDVSSVRFSADGSRALLLGHGAGCGESTGGSVLFEVDTSDLSIVRTVRTPRGPSSTDIAAAFYDAQTGALRVALVEWEGWRLSIGQVDETGAIVDLREICTNVANVEVSSDGRIAVAFLRNDDVDDATQRFHVLDLDALETRRTVSLGAESGQWGVYNSSLSADGTEIVSITDDAVVVVDTRTGTTTGRARISKPESSYLSMSGGPVSGGPRLVTATSFTDAGEPRVERNYWIGAGAPLAADRRIAMACGAAGGRFGIDARGMRLFQLDDRGTVVTTSKLERPDLTGTLTRDEQPMVFGFTATPDARFVLVLVGIPSGC